MSDLQFAAKAAAIDTLQVVFKVMERCNINCSYCYYFNMGNSAPMSRPVKATRETVAAAARWIAGGVEEANVKRVAIAFHGGEPMMARAREFDEFCSIFKDVIGRACPVVFSIQTNGTILSDEWLDVFSRHNVHVGISIDGDRNAHDRHRLDHKGRSTFAVTENNIRKIVSWSLSNPNGGVSAIAVMDWRNDYRVIYRYLRSLGLSILSFLLPDRNRDDGFASDEEEESYGRCLGDLFEAWLEEDDPTVHIRQVYETIQYFLDPGENSRFGRRGWTGVPQELPYRIIVLQSDGKVGLNDSYIPALDWYKTRFEADPASLSLRELLYHRELGAIDRLLWGLPEGCSRCEWRGICRGGDLENRFSSSNGFKNPSVYCKSYKLYYSRVVELLEENGYPLEKLEMRKFSSLPEDTGSLVY